MAEGLKLVVGADVNEAEKGLKRLVDDMQKTGDAAEKLGTDFSKAFGRAPLGDLNAYVKGVQNLKTNLNNVKVGPIGGQLAASVATANAELKKLPNVSNAATSSLINLGRVAQDAPFGFLGIANNLNPLLEGFQRLKQQSGSTGTALKALGSSLLGAGGIGLALSVVSSLLIVFGDRLFGASKAADDSKGRLDSLNDSIKRVTENIGDLTSAIQFQNELGAINVKIGGFGDIQDLREQSVAQQQLVEDLGAQVLKAQKNFSDAQLENQRQANEDSQKVEDDALKALNAAQDAQAAAREKGTIIFRKIALQRIDDAKADNKKEEDLQKKNIEALKKYIDDAKRLNSELERVGFVAPANFSFFDSQEEALTKAKKVFADFASRDLEVAASVFSVPLQITEPPPEQITNALTETEKLVKRSILQFPPAEIPVEFSATEEQNAAFISDFRKQFEAIGLGLNLIPEDLADPALFGKLSSQLKEATGAIEVANAAASVLSNTFQSLFSRIIEGENPIKAFFQSIGQAILQLITQLIAAAIKAAIFQAILSAATGGVGGGAGIFKFLAKGITGFAQGGIVSGPTLALVGEGVGTSRSNPEVIAPLDQLKSMLSGFGGSGQSVVIVNGRTRGNQFELLAQRTQKQNRRLGAG